MLDPADTRHDGRDGGVGEGELDRRRLQRDAVTVADRGETTSPVDDIHGGGPVIEAARLARRGENAAVHDPTDDDGDVPLDTRWQKVRQGVLVEERIATGDEEDVEVALASEPGQHRGLVHPGTDRPDDAVLAQSVESWIRLSDRRLPVVVRVVEEEDVDPVEPEPPEALLDRSQDPVPAEVEDDAKPRVLGPIGAATAADGVSVDVRPGLDLSGALDEPADLRR